jgi:hypothetical protein
MDKLKKEVEEHDEDKLEIVSVSGLQENKDNAEKDGKRILVPLPEDIYYVLSLYHFGEKLTPAEEDIIGNHPLKNREEYIKKFKRYLPRVSDENIPGVVMWVMKKYLNFMAGIEKTTMQIIFAERIIELAGIKKKGVSLPPYSSPDLTDFWGGYKKGRLTPDRTKKEVVENLNLLVESAETRFDIERKEFFELISKSFSKISDIGDDKNIRETLIKDVKDFISEKYNGMEDFYESAEKTELQKREFPFMPDILEVIIKTENLINDPEVASLIKKLEFSTVNLNIAIQTGVEDAMNAFKPHVLVYFYSKADGKFSNG